VPNSEKDELGLAFVKMIAGWRELVGGIVNNTDQVNSASNQLATTADQVGQATQQIAAASQEQARGVGLSANLSNQISAAVQQVAANVQAGGRRGQRVRPHRS
jgi:methyl-accepting chemotaxis protein